MGCCRLRAHRYTLRRFNHSEDLQMVERFLLSPDEPTLCAPSYGE